jgi:hypothetical protein
MPKSTLLKGVWIEYATVVPANKQKMGSAKQKAVVPMIR